jgi:NAD+ kinase
VTEQVAKLGIFYHPQVPAAFALAEEIARIVDGGRQVWISSPWDDAVVLQEMQTTNLLICIGGDGTVLRAARTVIPRPVPILTVNMGRLGFLSEIQPDATLARLPEILAGRYRLERRTMVCTQPILPNAAAVEPARVELHGLNDVVIGRASVGRPVLLTLMIDDVHVGTLRADALLVATATGSTGYNLSAGGPILPPEATEMIVTAVAPHLSRLRPIVLPEASVLNVIVHAEHEAILSVDGQVNRPLTNGEQVRIERSPFAAHLIRLDEPAHFYRRLSRYLDLVPEE